MNSQNDNSGLAMIAVVIGAAGTAIGLFVAAIGLVLAALTLFATFAFTILALFAWFKPVKIGNEVFTPAMARNFVYGGLWGGALLVGFAAFIDIMFVLGIQVEWTPQIFLCGYVAGAFFADMTFTPSEIVEPAGMVIEHAPAPTPPPVVTIATTPMPSAEAPKPFKYAAWNEEWRP